jgi:hypothetical protein
VNANQGTEMVSLSVTPKLMQLQSDGMQAMMMVLIDWVEGKIFQPQKKRWVRF